MSESWLAKSRATGNRRMFDIVRDIRGDVGASAGEHDRRSTVHLIRDGISYFS